MLDEEQMTLAFMLSPRNQEDMDTLLRNQKDSKHPLYRKYLNAKDFADRFSPTQADYDKVSHFLELSGFKITETTPNRLLITATGPVSAVNRTLHVNMARYHDGLSNRDFFATDREPSPNVDVPLWNIGGLDNYSIPQKHLSYVQSSLQSGTKNSAQQMIGSAPGGYYLGSDLRAAYYSNQGAGGGTLTGTGQAVGLFELDGYSMSDVQAYYTNTGQTLTIPIHTISINGANTASDGNDAEQVADIIYAASMAPGLDQIRVYVGSGSAFYVGYTDALIFNQMATDNIAKQIGVSWGWKTVDASTLDPIFKEMAIQGQTIFAASGDNGSYDNATQKGQRGFFPAEDPYITAVGGTSLTTSGPGGSWKSETAWGPGSASCPGSSGGGVSPDNIAIPGYQTLQTPLVINSLNVGSTTLRNIPDVAASADCAHYSCANGQCQGGWAGTSIATPVWAGYMALINEQATLNSAPTVTSQAVQAGVVPTLGWLNPMLYDEIGGSASYGTLMHDINTGSNGTYQAVNGYDLVTGWGSPGSSALASSLAIGANCGYMAPGHILKAGQSLWSCDNRFDLYMQATDGNLVLYENGRALWATGTNGNPGAYAAMQTDGNFVVYTSSNRPIWSSATNGNPGYYLDVQTDGNLVIYDPARKPHWASNTSGH